jgi:hypothetical protein
MMALFFQKFLGAILGYLSVNFYGLHVHVASFTDPLLYTIPTEFLALIVEALKGSRFPFWQQARISWEKLFHMFLCVISMLI